MQDRRRGTDEGESSGSIGETDDRERMPRLRSLLFLTLLIPAREWRRIAVSSNQRRAEAIHRPPVDGHLYIGTCNSLDYHRNAGASIIAPGECQVLLRVVMW